MTMNIKDPAVHKMAKEIAAQTGESVTEVVRVALMERKERLLEQTRKTSLTEIHAVLEGIRATKPIGPWIDVNEFLYDDHGLPA